MDKPWNDKVLVVDVFSMFCADQSYRNGVGIEQLVSSLYQTNVLPQISRSATHGICCTYPSQLCYNIQELESSGHLTPWGGLSLKIKAYAQEFQLNQLLKNEKCHLLQEL